MRVVMVSRRMAKFFLRLRQNNEPREVAPTRDSEYLIFDTLEAARIAAMRHARDLLSLGLARGRIDLARRFDIDDDRGCPVASIKFVEAVDLRL